MTSIQRWLDQMIYRTLAKVARRDAMHAHRHFSRDPGPLVQFWRGEYRRHLATALDYERRAIDAPLD